MRHHRIFLYILLFLLFAGTYPACTPEPSKGGLGDSCQVGEDCKEGLRCIGRICRSIPANKPPQAIASFNPSSPQTGEKVFLDASRSRDDDNDALDYIWTLEAPAGSKAKLDTTTQNRTGFVPDIAGTYKVNLEVGDGKARSQLAAPLAIEVKEAPNDAPIADAGPDQKTAPSLKTVLDGRNSKDPDGEASGLTFSWKITKQPDGSNPKLDKADTAQPELTPDKEGEYIVSLVVTDARGLASAPDTLTITAILGFDKEPTLASVSPTEASTESAVDLVLKGTGFVAGARLDFGNRRLETRYVSDTELKIKLDLRGVGAGSYDMSVININNKRSNALQFKVNDIPLPEITSITPDRAGEGQKLEIQIVGKGFIQDSQILFETTPLATTYISPTQIKAPLDLQGIFKGTYKFYVLNPGGRRSASVNFEVLVLGPPPQISLLNPPFATAGTKLPFSVHGTGFEVGVKLFFNGKEIPSVRPRRDEVQADPELDLTNVAAGAYDVWVKNPSGQESNKFKFNVEDTDPAPILDRVIPFNLYIGEENKVNVNGQRFRTGLKFFIDNKEITKISGISPFFFVAELNPKDYNFTPGNYNAHVQSSTGKKSNNFTVTVTYRAPQVTALTPDGWNTKCDTDVVVYGRNFVATSELMFGNTSYTTTSTTNKLTFVSAQELRISVKGSNLVAGSYQVKVINGPGAESAPQEFAVQANSETSTRGIDSIAPSAAPADTIAEIELDYSSGSEGLWRPGAIVEMNGVPQSTTCTRYSSSSTNCSTLSVRLNLNGIAPGKVSLAVVNPCGAKSATATFAVLEPPHPYVSSVSPPYAKVGDKVKIVINGANFGSNHKLLWNGTAIDTNFVSDKQIETKLPVDFTGATPGEIKFVVDNQNAKKTNEIRYSILAASATLTIDAFDPNNFQRGQSYGPIKANGKGFTTSTEMLFENQVVASTFSNALLIEVTKIDANSLATGNYYFQAREGTTTSNLFMIFVKPVPPPIVDYISPTSVVLGSKTSVDIYFSGERMCDIGTGYYCLKDPVIKIIDPKGKDVTSAWQWESYIDDEYADGILSLNGLEAGDYIMTIANPTGEESNPVIFTIKPPPAPTATSVSPPIVYRGVAFQQVNITGTNLLATDIVIFNNNLLNPIPGTTPKTSTFSFTLNLSNIKYAGQYPLYVLRCKDPSCNVTEKSAEVKLNVQNPDCSKPCASGESCDTNVCRPSCTQTSQCSALPDAPANVACTGGFCK